MYTIVDTQPAIVPSNTAFHRKISTSQRGKNMQITSLHSVNRLQNEYFALRHGPSKANKIGIILSDLYDGQLEEFSLTEEGEASIWTSVESMKSSGELDADTIIISSPFSRCKKSAQIAKTVLRTTTQIFCDERLRERWFGNLERKSNQQYANVWVSDKFNPNHTNANVESASAVQQRTASLITDLERRYKQKNILLVSHGDALQIMQTVFAKQCASTHRELPHLETATIRKLELRVS